MKNEFKDILEMGNQVGKQPLWFDSELAIPRFCTYNPRETYNIYAEVSWLVRIRCQGCKTPFLVSMSLGSSDLFRIFGTVVNYLKECDPKKNSALYMYGDPPNIRCCPAGPTMSSIEEEIVEFWYQDKEDWTWKRKPEYEINLNDE